ncbi:hypothetical protein E2320_014885 [Naja naja]|nr:hypothetical protein E2320_014885 [Naja naja]
MRRGSRSLTGRKFLPGYLDSKLRLRQNLPLALPPTLARRRPTCKAWRQNQQLRDCNRGLCCPCELEWEMGYLRAVLVNQNALGCLLRCLARDGAGSLGLCMISISLFQPTAAGAFGENADHDYMLPIPSEESSEKLPSLSSSATPSSVSLHVDRNHLSVEFCSL